MAKSFSDQYDVALSFAGEDRDYVDQVARDLTDCGVRVFYDKFEEVVLWGRDLVEHLMDVYTRRAKFCVIFVSKHYVSKAWPTHERKAAQSRAIKTASPYILPARFDNTAVPGMPDTVAWVDLKSITPKEFASMIIEKLKEELGEAEKIAPDKNNSQEPLMNDGKSPRRFAVMAPQLQSIYPSDSEWIFDELHMLFDLSRKENMDFFSQLEDKSMDVLNLFNKSDHRKIALVDVDHYEPINGYVISKNRIGRNQLLIKLRKIPTQKHGLLYQKPKIDAESFAREILLNEYKKDRSIQDSDVSKLYKSYRENSLSMIGLAGDKDMPEGLFPASPIPHLYKKYSNDNKEFEFLASAAIIATMVLSRVFYRIRSLSLNTKSITNDLLPVSFLGVAVPENEVEFGLPIELHGTCDLSRDSLCEWYDELKKGMEEENK